MVDTWRGHPPQPRAWPSQAAHTRARRLHAAVHIHVFDAAELAESVRTYRRGRQEKRTLPRRLRLAHMVANCDVAELGQFFAVVILQGALRRRCRFTATHRRFCATIRFLDAEMRRSLSSLDIGVCTL